MYDKIPAQNTRKVLTKLLTNGSTSKTFLRRQLTKSSKDSSAKMLHSINLKAS